MIKELITRWEENKNNIATALCFKHPEDYKAIINIVVQNIAGEDKWGMISLDPERIHEINDGDYQGTLLYVIGEKGYQPSQYYAVSVGYGSCSGCDTLESIADYGRDKPPTEDQVHQYMMLALNIVQGLKPIPNGYNIVEET